MAIKVNFENTNKRRITVNDLDIGDIFIHGATLYMLTDGGKYGVYYVNKDDDIYKESECEYFAIELSRGILKSFDGSIAIGFVEKDLEIKIDKEDISEWM